MSLSALVSDYLRRLSGGDDLILSEDLNDGQDYDGIRVENPFAGR